MEVFDISESAVRKSIIAFNAYGVDGVIAKRRTGPNRAIPRTEKEKSLKSLKNLDVPAYLLDCPCLLWSYYREIPG